MTIVGMLVVGLLVTCVGERAALARTKSEPLLTLYAEVTRATLERRDGSIRCHVELKLAFVNKGDEPVILVRPWEERGGWFGGTRIFATEADAADGPPMLSWYYGESSDSGEQYHELARRLDQALPPEDATITIAPGSTWNYETSTMVLFDERQDSMYPEQPTWGDIVAKNTKPWMRVGFDVWPFNVETVRPNFGSELAKRWRRHGRLLIGEPSGRGRHHARITSEPLVLDLTRADGFDAIQAAPAK